MSERLTTNLPGKLATARMSRTFIILTLTAIALASLTWANHRFAAQNPGGNDFLPRWAGTHLYLTRGWDPYGEQTSSAIQGMIYGRPARANEDQALFVYPLYSVLIFGPFGMIGDYGWARALWMTLLEVAIVLLGVLSLSLAEWRIKGWRLAIFFLFTVLWYNNVRSLINGNAALFCALFIVAALLAIRGDRDVEADVLLSLSSIKPQMVVLLVPFVLLWGLSCRRWTLLFSTIGSLALLIGMSCLMSPTWITRDLAQVMAYPQYTRPGAPGAIFASWWPDVGPIIGRALTAILAITLGREWWCARRHSFARFAWTALLTLAVTNLIGVRTATDNFAALYPALIVTFARLSSSNRRMGRWVPALIMPAMLLGIWGLFLATLEPGATEHSIMFFPVPLLTLAGLYMTRDSDAS